MFWLKKIKWLLKKIKLKKIKGLLKKIKLVKVVN